MLVCIEPYHICRYFNSPSFTVLIFKNGQLVEVKPKLSNIKLIIFATLFNHLGSSCPFLRVGSEYFLKKMSCLLTTRLTMQEGQSQSWPSAGQDFAPLPSSPWHNLNTILESFFLFDFVLLPADLLTISELLFCLHCLTTPVLFRPNWGFGVCCEPHLGHGKWQNIFSIPPVNHNRNQHY